MKRFYLIMVCILFAAGALYPPASALAKILETTHQVDMKGRLKKPGTKSDAQPVAVFQSEHNLQVFFLDALGNLEIEARDGENQPVYRTTVNATAGGQLNINISKWKQGEYTLTIADEEDGYLEGQFSINSKPECL